MSFNSTTFVAFFALVFFAYWALARTRTPRFALLFVASALFYMSWNARFLVLILFSATLDFAVGRRLHRTLDPRARKLLLGLSLAGNLGLLGYFKYSNFFVGSWVSALETVGLAAATTWVPWEIVLPVGISFYTFQTLSYTIDIYRRELEPTDSFLKFALFVSFFPQLVAGPIVRARDFLPQLEKRAVWDEDAAQRGLFLIAVGLIKKVALADPIGVELVDPVFAAPAAYSAWQIVIAVWGALFQFYLDFSAYSDIAIGAAAMLGFRLPLNFDRPFLAQSISEFWRRWHITMSTWFRDYVFFSLGGTRAGQLGRFRNILATMFLTGLWHGAGWNFVIWGLFHGVLTWLGTLFPKHDPGLRSRAAARAARGAISGRSGLGLRFVRRAVVFNLVALSMLFFRNGVPPHGAGVEGSLAMLARLGAWGATSAGSSPLGGGLLAVAALIHFTPKRWVERSADRWVGLPSFAQALLLIALAGILAVAAYEEAPFIYFQF